MDTYENYKALQRHETEGRDYVILFRETQSAVAVIAPHGGGIEPGTVDLADAVAGSEHTFYAFKGIKKKDNAVLHIQSNHFDEPTGVRIAKRADVVVTLHGYHGKAETVFIGGKDQPLKNEIRDALNSAGFEAQISSKPGLRAQHPQNICNRCRSGQGVQLEISRGLRKKMFTHLASRSLRKRTGQFYSFVDAIKKALPYRQAFYHDHPLRSDHDCIRGVPES